MGPPAEYCLQEEPDAFDDYVQAEPWSSSREDALRLADVAARISGAFIVLDDYRVDETYQTVLRDSGLRWLQFEYRTENPLWASIVLNASPTAKSSEYDIRNPDARLLFGPRYATLRPEFAGLSRRTPVTTVRRVLVAFGAGDDRGAVEFTLSSLLPATPRSLSFVVLCGRNNPAKARIQEWIAHNGEGRVSLSIDPPSVSRLMQECDLAVTSGGTLTYELAACEVPMITLAISDNQRTARGWQDLHSAVYLGDLQHLTAEKLIVHFLDWYAHPRKAAAAATRARGLVDGRGSGRVAHEVVQLLKGGL